MSGAKSPRQRCRHRGRSTRRRARPPGDPWCRVTGGSHGARCRARSVGRQARSASSDHQRGRARAAPHGIQVALLIVDAGIQPLTGSTRPVSRRKRWPNPHRIADAVLFLANQDARARRHTSSSSPRSPRTGRPEARGAPVTRITVIRDAPSPAWRQHSSLPPTKGDPPVSTEQQRPSTQCCDSHPSLPDADVNEQRRLLRECCLRSRAR